MTRRYSKATVIKELEAELGSYRSSYSETDGVIRDRGALKTMACIEQAIEAVRMCPPVEATE